MENPGLLSHPHRRVTVRNATRGCELGTRIDVADSFWLRLRGLIGRKLGPGEGLLLFPCRAVHTVAMSHPIDVIMLDAEGQVVALYPELALRKRTRWHARATHVLEVRPGTIGASGTRLGDSLVWDDFCRKSRLYSGARRPPLRGRRPRPPSAPVRSSTESNEP
jgi:uncharacterized protein